MNNSFLLVAAAAIAVALGLFLVLGQAEPVSAPEVAEIPEAVLTEEVLENTEESAVRFWEPVSGGVTMTAAIPAAVSYGARASAPCPSCGAMHPSAAVTAVAPASRQLVGGCGGPAAPCGKPACSVCNRPEPARPAPEPEGLVRRCGGPATPCGKPACSICERPEPACPAQQREGLVRGCGEPVLPCGEPACDWPVSSCATPCENAGWERPGINRSTPTCVDECSYLQLHSTARHPICSAVRFEWAASRGSFLDPTASDPLYFTPTIHQPAGEEVWITLTITDATGVRYTDQIQLFIRNVR